MKTTFILFFLLLPLISISQQSVIPYDKETQKITFDKVYNAYGRSAEEVKKHGVSYLQSLGNRVSNINTDSADFVTADIPFSFKGCKRCCLVDVMIKGHIKIYFKQVRTKIEISTFTYSGETRAGTSGALEEVYSLPGCKTYVSFVNTFNAYMWSVVTGYHNYLKKALKNNEDW